MAVRLELSKIITEAPILRFAWNQRPFRIYHEQGAEFYCYGASKNIIIYVAQVGDVGVEMTRLHVWPFLVTH